MKAGLRFGNGGYDKASLLKTAGVTVVLAAAAWLLAPVLLPNKPPADFPALPDLQTANQHLRALLESADREARRRPGSAEAAGRLGMAYHANLYFEQAGRAYQIAARLAPGDYRWAYDQAVLYEETGDKDRQLKSLRDTVRLKRDHALALLKLGDWMFKFDRLDEAARYYREAATVPGNEAVLPAIYGLGRIAARRRDWNLVIEHIAPVSRVHPYLRPPYDLLRQAYEGLGQADKAAEARRGAALAGVKVLPPPDDPLNEELTVLCYSSTRLLKLAGLLSRTGHASRALEVARRAASVNPEDPDARYFIAHTLITSPGNQTEAADEALTQLGECIRLRPDDLTPLWNFTNDFFTAPRPQAAVERLHALLLPHANGAGAHLSLGLVAEARGKTAEAISHYEAALKHNPGDAIAHNKLGQIFDRAGRYGEAAAHFRESIRLNPLNAVLRRNFGIALAQQGNYGQAVKEFGEALRINPYDAPTLIAMGFALLSSKGVDEAIPKFRDALRSQPDSAEAHYGLGFAWFSQGRVQDALPEVREALRLRPDFQEAQMLLNQMVR